MAAPKLSNINPVANSEFLLTVDQLPNVYWTEFSGVNKTFTRAKFNDGLANVERTAEGGIVSFDNVTISKPYNPETDGSVEAWIREHEGGKYFNFTIRPVRRSSGKPQPIGSTALYLGNCRIMSWSNMEGVNTGDGSQITMLKIVFTVETATQR